MGGHQGESTARLSICDRIRTLPRPLAFVLSGGAASGASQVGMLQALRRAGVAPDLIVGTSVGAINGALVAALPDGGADYLGDVWHEIDRDEILGSSGIRCLPRLMRTRRHLFPPTALQALIRRHLPVMEFASLAVPFAAVATRVADGTPTVLKHGVVERALLASTAIPGIFPRVEIDGHCYFDGGVTANVPVRQAFDLGAKSAIVLNAGPPPTERALPTNIAETMHYVATVLMRNQLTSLPDLSDRHRVIELPRTSPHGLGAFDFSRTTDLIDTARHATSAVLGVMPCDDAAATAGRVGA